MCSVTGKPQEPGFHLKVTDCHQGEPIGHLTLRSLRVCSVSGVRPTRRKPLDYSARNDYLCL